MPYKVAQNGIKEIHRILKPDCVYCSFISPLGTSLGKDYDGEIIINDEFERVQFNLILIIKKLKIY